MKTKSAGLLKALCLAAITILLQSSTLEAQSKFEYGFTYGPSNFLGDLGGNAGKGGAFLKDNMISLTRFMTGLYVGYRPMEFVNFRISLNAGKVEGADSLIKGNGGLEEARKSRNQHFRSTITEATLTAEIYPTTIFEYDPSDVKHKIRPYFLWGVGVFHFNPQAQYVNTNSIKTWVDLKPLRTEGQGMDKFPNKKEYDLTQINLPYGIGLKYFISEKFSISFEIVNRKTFTDYIDDVSTNYISNEDFYEYFGQNSARAQMAIQMANKSAFANGGNYRTGFGIGSKRGTPTNNDAYYSSSVKVSIRLGQSDEIKYNHGGDVKCPIIRF